MQMTYMSEERERQAFARRAAAAFANNPEYWTYSDGDIQPDAWFAMRHGLGDDCVVVFKIGDQVPVTNYQELIREYQL